MLKTFKKKLRKSSSSDDQSLQLSAEDQAGGTLTKKKTNLKTKLEVIRKQMGGNLSSLLSRHHYVDVRDDYISRVMTSLDKMRKEGVGCDVIGAHSIVLSYNNVLYEVSHVVWIYKENFSNKLKQIEDGGGKNEKFYLRSKQRFAFLACGTISLSLIN